MTKSCILVFAMGEFFVERVGGVYLLVPHSRSVGSSSRRIPQLIGAIQAWDSWWDFPPNFFWQGVKFLSNFRKSFSQHKYTTFPYGDVYFHDFFQPTLTSDHELFSVGFQSLIMLQIDHHSVVDKTLPWFNPPCLTQWWSMFCGQN